MDLNEIVVFTKVVQAGSFTAAARHLDLPKSTISRRVSKLEERLGARLLHRTTRKLALTDVGAAYYRRCARIVADVEEAELAVTQMQAAPRGTLRVTAPVEFGVAFLGPLVGELLRRYEELRVEVVLTDRLVDLVAEGFDVAIRAGPLADSTLVARRLGAAQRIVCASPAYLDRMGIPRTPEDLREHDCIVFRAGQEGALWRLVGPNGAIEVPVSGRTVVNNFDLVREAALAGVGIANLPVFRCAQDVQAGRLRTVLDDWSTEEVILHAVTASTRHLPPEARAFLDLLRERMTPPPWQLPREG